MFTRDKKIFLFIFSLVFTLCLVFFGMNIFSSSKNTYVKAEVWDGTVSSSFAGGEGTETSPYEIATADQLAYVANQVNNGTDYEDIYFTLTSDIVLNDLVSYNIWGNGFVPKNTWTPIGNELNYFKGTFDGNNHTISGIYINNQLNNQGLFCNVYGAVLKNIGIINSYVRGNESVGSIVGKIDHYSKVENCYNTSIVTGNSSVGGVVGYNDDHSTVQNCYNNGVITGNESYLGGIVGSNYNQSTIRNCYNIGKITGNNDVGGIYGYGNNSFLQNCYNTVTVTGSGNYVGGIFGYDEESYVENSYNSGIVTGNNYVGGFAGYQKSGVIQCCYYLQGVATKGIGNVTQPNVTNEFSTSGKIILSGIDGSTIVKVNENGETVTYTIDNGDTLLSALNGWISIITNPTNYTVWEADGNYAKFGEAISRESSDIWNGTAANYFAGGEGTQSNPYKIANAEQLALLKNLINGNKGATVVKNGTSQAYATLQSANYKLTVDIALNDISNLENWSTAAPTNSWTPIGNESYPFKGTFDGDNHTISGVYINNQSNNQGLFGKVNGAILKNIGIINSYIKGTNYVGGVVGKIGEISTVENCYNTASVFGSVDFVGGVVGKTDNNSIVNNCYNTGVVTGSGNDVGGVVGYNYFSTVQNCYNTGSITGSSNHVGGIVGANEHSNLQNCYNIGSVEGIIGYVGGIVGGVSRNVENETVTNCYNSGLITGASNYVGGIVGVVYEYNECKTAVINCYNIGSATGNSSNVGGIVGGFIGEKDIKAVINCYYLQGVAKDGNNIVQNGIGNDTLGSTTDDTYTNQNDFNCLAFTKNEDATFNCFENNKVAFWGATNLKDALVYKAAQLYDSNTSICSWTIVDNQEVFLLDAPIKVFSVTLNENEVVYNDGYTEPTSYTYGIGLTLPTSENITKTGYIFGGWYENSECTGTAITSISATDIGDKTFYAKWIAETYDVTHALTNISATAETSGKNKASYHTLYATTLTAEDGYYLPSTITVKVGGVELATSDYTYTNGVVTIPAENVTGNIEIIAVGKLVEFSSDWKDNLPNNLAYDTVTGIKFVSDVPSGYSDSGINYNGMEIYVSNSNGNDIAYVYSGKITANTNMKSIFSGCDALKTIVFSNFDTSNVTDMSNMFFYSSNLIKIDLSGFNTEKVTDMSKMFYNCSALNGSFGTSDEAIIKIGNGFKTANVTDMSNMFYGCKLLTSIDLSGFNTEKVTNMSYMFYRCYLLNGRFGTSDEAIIKIGNDFTTANVTNMSNMFYGCDLLTSIDISGFNTEKVTNMSAMFCFCNRLTGTFGKNGTAIKIGDSFTTTKVTDMSYMFYGGNKLTSIDISGFNTEIVENMSYMFFQCCIISGTFGKNGSDINISDNFTTVNVTNMSNMFNGCNKLTSIDISGFNTEKVTDMSYMFSFCMGLTGTFGKNGTAIKIGDSFTTSKVTDMSNMFYYCPNLTKIDLSGFNTEIVTDMSNMFSFCNGLTGTFGKNGTAIKIGDSFTTTKVTDMSKIFYFCPNLTKIDLSGFNTEIVENMQYMFCNCSALDGSFGLNGTAIKISDNFTTANVINMTSMFSGCALTSIDLSGFDMVKVTNMNDMLYSCTDLSQIIAPKNILDSNYIQLSADFYYKKGNTFDKGKNRITSTTCSDTINNAIYSRIFSVILNGNEGVYNDEYTEPTSYTYGIGLTLPTSENITKTGYTFGGWYDNSECTGTAITNISATDMGDKTYYANWIPETYDVTHALTNISATEETAGENKASYHTLYSTTLTAEDGYYLPSTITVKVGGVALATSDYTYTNGVVTIPAENVIGKIEITAEGQLVEFSSEWKNNLPSGITYSKVTGIKFLSTAPSGYTYNKTYNGMDIYVSNTDSKNIAYVSSYTIKASSNSNELFRNCSALLTIDFDNFDTSNVTNMSYMFIGCTDLSSLNLSCFNTKNVTTMAYMFADCSKLTFIGLSGFNTGLVEDMSHMFSNCWKLTSINLSGFNTAKVTNMASMFSICTKLTSLDLSGFNTSLVEDMSSMFSNCYSLKGSFGTSSDAVIKISDSFTTESVKNMSYMFSSCSNLTSIDLSGFNTDLVQNMSSMFKDCTALNGIFGTSSDAAIKIGDNFTAVAVTDMTSMFSGCSKLTLIDLSGFNTVLVENMSAMFYNCEALKSIDLSGFNTALVENMSDMFYNCQALKSIDLSGFNTGLVQNMSCMFYNCSALEGSFGTSSDAAIKIGVNFTTATVTNMRGMFADCSKLTSLDLSGFNTEKATDMLSMFLSCSQLTSLDLSGFNTGLVENMSSMFMDCTALNGSFGTSSEAAIKIGSNFTTAAVANMSSMFSGCSKLTSIDLSGFNTGLVQNMSYMFKDCTALNGSFGTSNDAAIKIGDGFTTAAVANMSSMFNGCSQLSSLDLSGFNTGLVKDMSSMFKDCTALNGSFGTSNDAAIKIGDNFTTAKVTTMSSMYNGCSQLTSIDLSGFNTEKVASIYLMFNGCSQLTTIDLSGFDMSLVSNTTNMLSNCNNLYQLTAPKNLKSEVSITLPATYGYIKGSDTATNISSITSTTCSDDTNNAFYNMVFKLTLNENDGVYNDEYTEPTSYTYGTGLTLPTSENITKIGYTFDGWYDNNECTGTAITSISATDMGEKTYYANWTAIGSLFENVKFYKPQVWDCQRSPAFPIADKTIRISGLTTAYDDTLTAINWQPYDYITFELVYDKVSLIPDATIRNRIINSLMLYTGCSAQEIENGVVVKEILHNSNGTIKKELSDIGLIWALGDEGFLYTAMNGSLSNSGGVGTYVTFAGHKQGDSIVYVLDKSKPEEKQDILDKNDIKKYGDNITPNDNTFYIGGTVVDENGNYLSGITVTVTYNETPYTFTTSSVNGTFLSDKITLVEGITTYTVVITDGIHSSVTYNKSLNETGFGNESQVCTATDLYIYDSPSSPKQGENRTFSIKYYDQGITDKIAFTGDDCTSDSYTVGTGYILPTPTRIGYTFEGWFTTYNGTTKASNITAGDFEDKTYYAKWIETYDVTHTLTNISATEETAGEDKAIYNNSYSTTLTAEDGYYLPSTITVKVGGVELATSDYTYTNGVVTIPAENVTGNIEIIAVGQLVEFSSDWKNNLPNNLAYDTVTGIKFVSDVPSGYSDSGINYNGMEIYVSNSNGNDIAYVYSGKITANSNMFSIFGCCESLKTIDFSNFDTSNVTDMSKMFYCCFNLTKIDLIGFNTEKVTNMPCMFYCCLNLTKLDLSGFNTEKVTNMLSMFYSCYSLKGSFGTSDDAIIKIGNDFTTANVTNLSGMFDGANKLTSIDISGFNTEKVTNMSNMFNSCFGLNGSFGTSNEAIIKIGNDFTTANVTNMSGMFCECNKLTSIDLSGFNTEKVTNMLRMFKSCYSLKGSFGTSETATIKIGNDFKTDNVTDMSEMFYSCSNLTKLDLSGFNTGIVISLSNMFNNCFALDGSFGLNGTAINIGNHFTTKNVITMSFMFYNCSKLTLLDLSGFDMIKVTDTMSMISQYDKKLVQVIAPKNIQDSYSIDLPSNFNYIKGNTTEASKNKITSTTCSDTINNAIYSRIFSVILNGNEGVYNDEYTEPTSYTYGTGLTLPTSENITKTGYSFDGWYDNSDCTGTAITSISATDMGEKTYYAKWTVNTYTVTLNENEGSYKEIYIKPTSYTYGIGLTLPTSENITKTGYSFDGWYDNSECTGTVITSISATDIENKTYYAKWIANTYTVTFNENEGSYDESYNKPTIYTYGVGLTLPTSTEIIRKYYTFLGWTLTNETSDTAYITEISSTQIGDKTYYAKWNLITFEVHARDLDGLNITLNVSGIDTIEDVKEKIATISGMPKEVFELKFGNTVLDKNKTIDEYNIQKEANLHVVKNTYVITFEIEGVETKQNVEYGTIPEYNGTTPTKTATAQYTYTFKDWGETITAVTGNKTYTAQFTSTVNKYKITWIDGNNNTIETDNEVEYGMIPEYNGTTPTKTATAQYTYTFKDWGETITAVTGTKTYTAQFTANSKKIKTSEIDLENPEDKDKINGEINNEDGFKDNTTLVIKAIDKDSAKNTLTIPKGKTVKDAYNAALYVNGNIEELSGEVTIKFAKPADLENAESYTIIIVENGVTVQKTGNVDGDYIVFNTTVLGDFAVIADVSSDAVINLMWLVILLSVLLFLEIVLAVYKIIKDKKDDNMVKTCSFAPLILALLIPTNQIVAIVILSVLCVVIGVYNIYLYLFKNRKVKTKDAKKEDKEFAVTINNTLIENVEGKDLIKKETIDVVPEVETKSNENLEDIKNNADENLEKTETKVDADFKNAETKDDEDLEDTEDKDTEDFEEDEDEEVFKGLEEETGLAILVRYRKSFTAKLIQSPDETKNKYGILKNAILSFKKVTSRISWNYDSINNGRNKLVKFNVRGKTLYLYMALNPDDYVDTKYKVERSESKKYEDTPCLYKIKNIRRVKYAIELIDVLADKFGLKKREEQSENYYLPYESKEALIDKGLIKELISKEKYEDWIKRQSMADVKSKKRSFISVREVNEILKDEVAVTLINEKNQSETISTKVKDIVNIDSISAQFKKDDIVNLQTLKEKGLLNKDVNYFKVLARGVIDKPLTIEADEFSIEAVKMILLTGGKVIRITHN